MKRSETVSMTSDWTLIPRAGCEAGETGSIDLDRIKEFDGVDVQSGESLLLTVLNLYLEVAPEYLRKIHLHLANGDIYKTHLSVHNLKSSSANVGATKLSQLCRNLEIKTEPNSNVTLSVLKIDIQRITTEFAIVKKDVSSIIQHGKGALQSG